MAKVTSLAKHLALSKDLGPERDYGERGRFKKIFSVMNANKVGMLAVNLLAVVFAVPMIVMFFVLMGRYEQAQVAAEGYNFSGFMGIGYGIADDTVAGINLIYGIRQDFFLYFFTPAMAVFSIGAAGAYHCIRNYLWGSEVKVFKHFFRGIKLHWWKFLSAFVFMGLVGTNAAYSTIELIKLMSTVGSAGAGIWVWCISALLIALMSLIFFGMWLPMSVTFKFGFRDGVKNALICILIMGLLNLIVLVATLAPLGLVFVDILKYIVYAAMIAYGVSFLITCNLSYGMFAGDLIINTLSEYERREAEKQNRDARKAAKNRKKNGGRPRGGRR